VPQPLSLSSQELVRRLAKSSAFIKCSELAKKIKELESAVVGLRGAEAEVRNGARCKELLL
jgi:hypothetical protein